MPKEWEWGRVPEEAAEHLTDAQQQVFSKLRGGATMKTASKELGLSFSAVQHTTARIRSNLRKHDCTPETGYKLLSDAPYSADRKTAHYKVNPESGELELAQIWVKPKVENEAKALDKYVEGLMANIKPAPKTKKPKGDLNKDLMSAIFIGDAHVGMYAYAPETKHSDFDSDIASRDIRAAIDDLVERSPNAETGLLVDVGDFMHMSSSHMKTFAGTDVDVDTRFDRVMETAGCIMQYAIMRMLEKFAKVICVISIGNHNRDTAVAVQQITSAYFRNEPRVDVLKTSGFFHYIEWGKWLIGVNHGDKVKPQKLVNVMARDMPGAWGRTTHRMWAVGHVHHQNVLELDGCIVQKFAALPPPDSWHSSMGYSSGQAMQMIVFKKGGGTHSTLIYNLDRQHQEPDRRIA